jgi:hypothetical protein
MIAALGAACYYLLYRPDFFRQYFSAGYVSDDISRGEMLTIMILANNPEDQVLQWINEEFPDDPYPVARLDPDAPLEPSLTIHIGGIQ